VPDGCGVHRGVTGPICRRARHLASCLDHEELTSRRRMGPRRSWRCGSIASHVTAPSADGWGPHRATRSLPLCDWLPRRQVARATAGLRRPEGPSWTSLGSAHPRVPTTTPPASLPGRCGRLIANPPFPFLAAAPSPACPAGAEDSTGCQANALARFRSGTAYLSAATDGERWHRTRPL
jgi:hypothetical protein